MRYLSPSEQMEFNQVVWEICRRIPSGQVATYGQLANLAGPPKGIDQATFKAWGARWAGTAMASCPDGVPWQRVINSKGEVSLRRGQGYELQKALLRDEGVEFDDRNRVNLKKFQWDGHSHE